MTDHSDNPQFWLRWTYARFGTLLDHVGCYKVEFKTQPVRFSTAIEVSEITYRKHYVEALTRPWRTDEDTPSVDDYWDLPYSFSASVAPRAKESGISGWVTFGGWQANDAEVANWLLHDKRSIANPPSWNDLALAATCTIRSEGT